MQPAWPKAQTILPISWGSGHAWFEGSTAFLWQVEKMIYQGFFQLLIIPVSCWPLEVSPFVLAPFGFMIDTFLREGFLLGPPACLESQVACFSTDSLDTLSWRRHWLLCKLSITSSYLPTLGDSDQLEALFFVPLSVLWPFEVYPSQNFTSVLSRLCASSRLSLLFPPSPTIPSLSERTLRAESDSLLMHSPSSGVGHHLLILRFLEGRGNSFNLTHNQWPQGRSSHDRFPLDCPSVDLDVVYPSCWFLFLLTPYLIHWVYYLMSDLIRSVTHFLIL